MEFVLTDDDLGELLLSESTGYVVENYDLGWGSVREVTYNRTNDDGVLDLSTLHGARTVTFQLALDGNVDAPTRLRDRLAAYAHPRRRPVLTFVEPGDDRTKRMALRGAAVQSPVAHYKYAKMAVSWLCADGVIEGSTEQTVTLRPGDTSGEVGRAYPLHYLRDYPVSATAGARLITNDGNADAHWTAYLYGAMTNPVLTIDGKSLSFNDGGGLTLISGEQLALASKGKKALINDSPTAPAMRYLNLATSQWVKIPPEGCTVELTASTFGAEAACVLTWRDTWV